MPLTWKGNEIADWNVKKIAVVGPGIVGMPMAALLAHARIREGGTEPARVLVVQRNSPTSGWKVDAINSGKSPIGGVEPALDSIVAESVEEGLLSASYSYDDLADADMILICTQTDKNGFAPEYGPLFEALNGIAAALQKKPAGNVPVVVFESTLAPSSMLTVVRPLFEKYGLHDGRDILLGNSPNRVMPGRLVERGARADKLAGGLHPGTAELITRIYARIVTGGTVYRTNSLTAEIVKTLENAYRDVRIAYAAEVARYCDAHDVDFFALRDKVNANVSRGDDASADPRAVPSGALLVPTVGVGGHCLPKDGILLWWRAIEAKENTSRSLILASRTINDESPAQTLALAERRFGSLKGKRAALLGVAYRFDSEDTRNSPTLVLAQALVDRGATVVLHDPYVHERDQNLAKTKMTSRFTTDLSAALKDAEVIFLCTAHGYYQEHRAQIEASKAGIVDACNLFDPHSLNGVRDRYTGIGRGKHPPSNALVDATVAGFRAVEMGVANELHTLIDYLNARYATDDFNRATLAEVRRLAATCTTGCDIAQIGEVRAIPAVEGFTSRLAATGLA
ncbi:MAG: nucleotide sugar dehydrogenase [Gemmatimonadales bacterium]